MTFPVDMAAPDDAIIGVDVAEDVAANEAAFVTLLLTFLLVSS